MHMHQQLPLLGWHYVSVQKTAEIQVQNMNIGVRNGMPAGQLAVAWRKSARSNPSGACVEVAELPGGVMAVRNSRYPDGPALIWPRSAVAAFLSAARSGELNDLCSPVGWGYGVTAPDTPSWPEGCDDPREAGRRCR
jgi:hypothetical protein